MTSNYQRIQPGTNVYGSDGDKVGDVSEVGSNYVLVRQGWLFTTDMYIPLSAIVGVDNDGIRLNVTKDQIGDLGWDVIPTDEGTTSTYTPMSGATDTGYTTASSVQDTGSRTDYTATPSGTRDVDTSGEVAIPVVEEELRVGKREVEAGGVRVDTRVAETPVEEQVTLRDERVHVERRPVERSAADADFDRLQDSTLEVRERREEPVVDKQARVVEEVVVGKEARERTETVQDTVRRTDVDVQETPGGARSTDYTETGRASASDVAGTGPTSSTRDEDVSWTTSGDEGPIERTLGDAKAAAERTTGLDLDRSGEVGDRDRRDNF